MVEIAGGIILAVLFFALLPYLISITVGVTKWLVVIVPIGIGIYLLSTHFKSVLILFVYVLGAALFLTVFSALVGIAYTRLPFIKGGYANRPNLIKSVETPFKEHAIKLYGYYQPIGVIVASILFFGFLVLYLFEEFL
jgi:hypothetical protein